MSDITAQGQPEIYAHKIHAPKTYAPKTYAPMRQSASNRPFHAALLLIVFALAAATFGRVTGIGTVMRDFGQPADIRELVFNPMADGRLVVSDAMTGEQLVAFAEGQGGFARGGIEGLRRQRMIKSIAATEPYRLILWENGYLTLADPATGIQIELQAFGADNVKAFKQFLNRGIEG
jgi:putative photosynthetic complex assembly protein